VGGRLLTGEVPLWGLTIKFYNAFSHNDVIVGSSRAASRGYPESAPRQCALTSLESEPSHAGTHFTELCTGSEAGSYSRLVDFGITQH